MSLTLADIHTLQDAEIAALIEQYLHTDPAKVAFALAKHPHKTLIASQVKYLQRASDKLPHYFAARCVLLPISYEQSSSEATAKRKAAHVSGDSFVDITLGLGVDSYYFAQRFGKGVALEQDPLRAEIARTNFLRLGMTTVEVRCQSAEAFLHSHEGAPFDLLYCDPARRDTVGNRTLRVEDCSPNVRELLPLMLRHARQVLIKLSPLFDVAEAWRLHPNVARVSVISVHGECKELLIFIEQEPPTKPRISIETDAGIWEFPLSETLEKPISAAGDAPQFLLEPDAAFYKARLTQPLFSRYFPALGAAADTSESYFYAPTLPDSLFPGRIFEVIAQFGYKASELKKYLKAEKITAIHIARRNFPLSVAEIRKQIGIAEGGELFLLCTSIQGKKCAILAKAKQQP